MKNKIGGFFGHSQAGDTIVEVVIAIAIIATVLTGAFVVTNRSLTAVRDSEEHSEALQLLQGQIETLRSVASQAGNTLSKASTNLTVSFCFDSSGAYQTGNPCSSGSIPYKISIIGTTATPVSGGTTTFLGTVTWSALGGGTDQVELAYKVEVE